MKRQPRFLSNLFDDPRLTVRKGLRVIKTPDKTVWRGMKIMSDESPSRSISPCSRRKHEEMQSRLNFDTEIEIPLSGTARTGRKLVKEPEKSKNLADMIQKSPTVQYRRPIKQVFLNGEYKNSNQTSKENMLKTGWEVKYVGRKLPKPPC